MNLDTIKRQLAQDINQSDHKIDLARTSLHIAQIAFPGLSPEQYIKAIDAMAEQIVKTNYPLKIIKNINDYLFEKLEYRGNQADYYDPDNSFLNQVIARRKGIPISLSVLYLEIAKRLDFPMVPIGMPGHFLIRPEFAEVGIFVDVFNQGEILFKEDCQKKLQDIYGDSLAAEENFLQAVTNRQILGRMLTNLKFIYIQKQELTKAWQIIELILTISPEHPIELRDRGIIGYQLEKWQEAKNDLETYLRLNPTASDQQTILKILEKISNGLR